MELLLGILIEWLSLNANIEIKEPPVIVIVKSSELHKKYKAPVYAFYSQPDATIFVSSEIDLSTFQGASVLLHELVHHYQNISGAMNGYNCRQESERLAYKIQRRFLESNKAQLMPELGEFNINARSACSLF